MLLPSSFNNGNRTHKNGTQIATFDAQDRILTQGSASYSHNALGQRTEKNQFGQITRYDYDVFGGLKGVTLPNGTTIAYAQDPLGRRIGRKVNGSWTNKWLYKDSLNPIAELDGSDRLRKLFVYADKSHVPAYMITYNADGTEDKQYRIVSDLLGSVRVVYDLDSGDEVQRIDYDVWGNVANDTNPGFQPFGFAGGLYDPQAKLTRFGARDYDAETGRWTAKDPIQFAGGDTNLYGYVANDPVNFIDPEGKWSVLGVIATGVVAYGVYRGWLRVSDSLQENASNRREAKARIMTDRPTTLDDLKPSERLHDSQRDAINAVTDATRETIAAGIDAAGGRAASGAVGCVSERGRRWFDTANDLNTIANGASSKR